MNSKDIGMDVSQLCTVWIDIIIKFMRDFIIEQWIKLLS